MVEIELFINLAVIALLSFRQAIDVGFQFFLVAPSGAINTLQHFIVAVATPVGAGNFSQLKGGQFCSRRNMGAATEIDEVTLTVEANGLIVGNAGDNLSFVFLTNALKEFHRLITLPLFTSNTVVGFDQFRHARFNSLEIFRGKGTLKGEVVIEAIFNDRANGYLSCRKKLLYRHSQ